MKQWFAIHCQFTSETPGSSSVVIICQKYQKIEQKGGDTENKPTTALKQAPGNKLRHARSLCISTNSSKCKQGGVF